ncbi:MAG: hypothetical protein DRQ78_00195 [Epsilonproteobacteria bacterium]|nr:MAG: hypothetical protein DRQ78_00195 [Campylobacterota bacterium]
MQNTVNNTFAYTSSTLLNAYKKRRSELVPLLKEEKDKEKLKKIHLALLSIDLCVQIFNDANKNFPIINKEILKQDNQNINLEKNQTAGIKKLKKGIEDLSEVDSLIFRKKMYYSIELSNSNSKEIPAQIASNILKENAFLFTHVLHILYDNANSKNVFNTITAHVKYILGLCIIEPVSAGRDIYKEIIQEREEYKTSDDMENEIESFIFNSHHYCLTILVFTKHWLGHKEYSLEKAENDLNDKINNILKQRESNPT